MQGTEVRPADLAEPLPHIPLDDLWPLHLHPGSPASPTPSLPWSTCRLHTILTWTTCCRLAPWEPRGHTGSRPSVVGSGPGSEWEALEFLGEGPDPAWVAQLPSPLPPGSAPG